MVVDYKMIHYMLSESGDITPIDTSTPEGLEEWGEWYNNFNRTIALNYLYDLSSYSDEVCRVAISTVFLSIDHGNEEGYPIVFETMVFGVDESSILYPDFEV